MGQIYTYGDVACHTCGEVLDSDVQPDSLPLDYGPGYFCGAQLQTGVSVQAADNCDNCDRVMYDNCTEVSWPTQ